MAWTAQGAPLLRGLVWARTLATRATKPLRQLERLQSLVQQVSRTNGVGEKRAILASFADLAPILERYVKRD